MKKSLLIQFVHNCIYTACFVQVFHVCRACRCKMAEVRSLCTDLVCKADIKVHSDLMSDSRKVKHTVCGASECHVYCQGIEDCFFLCTTLPMSSPASSSAPSPPSSPTSPPRRFKNDRQRNARHKFEPFISTDKSSAQVSQPTRFFYLCSVLSCQFFQHFPYIMRGVFLNLNDLCTGVLCYVPQVARDGGVVRTADDKEHVAGL